ncbi:MAG: ComEC family competence protein [Tagaea sp.]|nr:ComEC family competence protein [Tagaea sp.]
MHRSDPLALPADNAGEGGFAGFVLRTGEAMAPRLVLWLPVCFGGGIGLYFALGAEPEFWIAPAFASVALAFAILGRSLAGVRALAGALLALSSGFAVAQYRAHDVSAPAIERRLGPATIEGRVIEIEPRPEGVRVTLDRLSISGLAPERTPERVRLRLDTRLGAFEPGDEIRVSRAFLMPPPLPSAPGAFDFARQAWFERLGGVGYANGPLVRVAQAEKPGWRATLATWRADVARRTLAALPPPAGAIAAALITGEQGAVPPEALAAFRDSGLQHILSISGLHIGMVAGFVFFAVRLLLAFVPFVALRTDTKKIAAIAALAAITFYAAFAVPSVPTVRSWLMTGIVLLALLIDRTAITLRLVAWAAAAILLVRPESLLSASFQMSFGAVVALVAAWEASRDRLQAWRAEAGLAAKAGVWLAGSLMTSLVAGLASAPFALYHFNRFAAFGLLANLLGVPLTGFWIMPWAVLAGLLFPFGLEELALVPMGWGIERLMDIAVWVAGLDGAVALAPAMPLWGLVLVTLGGLWLCLWTGPVRALGAPAVVAGLLSMASVEAPDILVAGDGRLMAVRDEQGRLMLSSARGQGFARQTWLRRDGDLDDGVEVWPRNGRSADGRLDCVPTHCLYRASGVTVALVRQARALPAACRDTDLVIAPVSIYAPCRRATGRTIDRFDLLAEGAHAIRIENGALRVETVREHRGIRPWVAALPERAPEIRR